MYIANSSNDNEMKKIIVAASGDEALAVRH
jgi:hypothetical protein